LFGPVVAGPLSQPRDHADVDGIGFGDFGQRFTNGPALECFLALELRQLSLATKLDAVRLGTLPALTGAFLDQLPLKLGDCREQCRKQPALRGGGIKQGIAEAPEGGTGLADALDQLQQFPVLRPGLSSFVTSTTSPA
jgi:hypothetical protein